VQAPADRLDGIARASVDVVTTRSVLIYVQDKAAAFAEFRRVLRPGGRVSSYEPINILMHPCDSRRLSGFDLSPLPEIAAKIGAAFDAAEQPHAGPMLDFDDRDLVRLAEQAGFTEVSMDLRVTVRPSRAPLEWDSFLRSSGNPYLPPLGEMLARALTRAEFTALTAYLRPLVEAGHGERRLAVAYLTAREAG
jgi:SAM-dependent methyltransferase